MTAAVRISNFVLSRYPPVLSSVYALAFGAGGSVFSPRSPKSAFLPARFRCSDSRCRPCSPTCSSCASSTTSVTGSTTGSPTRNARSLRSSCAPGPVRSFRRMRDGHRRRESVLPHWNGHRRRSAPVRCGADGCRAAIPGHSRRQSRSELAGGFSGSTTAVCVSVRGLHRDPGRCTARCRRWTGNSDLDTVRQPGRVRKEACPAARSR